MAKLKTDGSSLFYEYQEKVTALKSDLIKHIQDLPDNPKIKRIGTDGKGFTMNASDMGEIWSPYYHDFKAQYESLVNIIDTKPIETVINQFESIIKTGYTGQFSKSHEKYHPDVREHLKKMM